MKAFLSISFLAALSASAEPGAPVALRDGASPDKKYEVVLEADKDSPSYKDYEFKGSEDQFPAFLIRDVKTHKVAARVRWMGDAVSDEKPLRLRSTVLWNPSGTSVILNTSERFYSHSGVWTLDQASGKFGKLDLPDYKTLTGFEAPTADELRPRGFSSSAWTKEGNLEHKLILSPLHPKEGGDPFRHHITLRIGPEGFKVIAREELKE